MGIGVGILGRDFVDVGVKYWDFTVMQRVRFRRNTVCREMQIVG